MNIREWPAEDYAIGSYIQATVADFYLNNFTPKSTDTVLDIGCGDGHYSKKILNKIPQGTLVGIDSSENMLKLAKSITKSFPNFKLEKTDVLNMCFDNLFDAVVSFWCLQWTDDVPRAFEKIWQALKPGGTVFTLFPGGDDPFMQSYQAVRNSGLFPELNNFIPPMDYSRLQNLKAQLYPLPYTEMYIERPEQSITLPNLSTFRSFVNGIAFYQEQVPPDSITRINEAMVQWYGDTCQKNFKGKYQFNFSPYYIIAKK